ncbi:Aste57867_13356 [Aphanomyces stellatus]|uniref:Aste57867_13356 protein n=1 Tax=Aphanomyces stellatus TaxID=120398 RepID=A0A485KYM8_9STRA|nr:hypothetical protein As57867_013306 [Aphanomyces stellatus]VFT90195.1 Aste57867_13356 [Aphanomyces stellatus]
MERTVRLPVIKVTTGGAPESNPIVPTPAKAAPTSSSRMMNRGGGAMATPRSLMHMSTPTTDELVHIWTFICHWIHERVEMGEPATIPGLGTVAIYTHLHNIRIPHFGTLNLCVSLIRVAVVHPAFAKKFNLFSDETLPAPMSHALEFRDIAAHCNIQELVAKSWLEHVLDNIGERMRTQPQVELSLGVGVVSCKNRFIDGHMTQKQPTPPLDSEVRLAEPVPSSKKTNPRSLMATSKTFTSYIVASGERQPSVDYVPTKPSSPTTAHLDGASPRQRTRGLVVDAASSPAHPLSPRFVLRQKFLARAGDDALPTTVLSEMSMPWDLHGMNQGDNRVDTVKQLDAKYPPLLDPFCRTLNVEQVDVVNKLTSSDRIGANFSLAASTLVIRKHVNQTTSSLHACGLMFVEDESSRVKEHFVTLRPPSPVHDKVELPLVTTAGKPVYAPESGDNTRLTSAFPALSRTRSQDGERRAVTTTLSKEEATARYLHYLDKIIDDGDIVPMNPVWTDHIKALIARAVARVRSAAKDAIVVAMFEETLTCYTYSIKKAILDYLLLRTTTQVRLNIPGGTPTELQVHEKWKWGQTHAMVMTVTPAWKERKGRAEEHMTQFLMLIDTHVMALHYMWGDFDQLLLVDLPTTKELTQQLTPLDVKAFERRQMAHAAHVKRTLMDKWFAKAKRILTSAKNDEVLVSALLHPKHYFDCVATLMSLQLRRLVVRSIDAYVAYFKTFAGTTHDTSSSSSIQGLLLSLLLDQTKIKFDTVLEDVQLMLLNVLYNIPSCLTHIDRVETKFEPSIILGGSPFLWGVGLHEAEVVDAADTIREILQENIAHAMALRTNYAKYSMVAAGDLPLDHFVSQTHDIAAYGQEINKYFQFACQISRESTRGAVAGLFYIDCKQLNDGLLQKAQHFIDVLFRAFSDATLRLNRDIRQQFKLIAGRLARKPIDLHELVDSEAYITKLRNQELLALYDNVANAKQRLEFLFLQCKLVRQCPALSGLSVSSDLLASTAKTFQWKIQIEKVLRDGDFSLQHERARIETAFIAKRSRFQAELEELEAEVTSFQKKSDLRHATTYVVQLSKIRDAITQARHTIDIIADEEAKLGWVQTDFLQLDYICETLDPYDHLWRTARDFREASVRWMRGNIFELDAKATDKTIHAMTTTLTNATKQLAATSPAAVGAAETLKKQIFEFKGSIGVITVMGNPNLRERHWTEIAETVGFIIDPQEHITLQRLLDLGVQESVARLLEISDAATMEAEIEKSLDSMSEEWLHMEFKFVVAGDTFVLAEGHVDEIHIKLDDHIVKTQTIRCSQYRKPFFGRAIAWERSLLKLRDLTELLWDTGRQWQTMAPLFAGADSVHAILDKMSNEAKKFGIVDGHWRSIMAAVVGRPLCLAVIQIEKAAERLRECLALLEAILEGLTAALEAKRALFSRFYLLSNAELIAALSVSPSALHVRSKAERAAAAATGGGAFLGRCFPGVGRVEMNSIHEITHVVSSMDETMQLSQVVVTDKLSTDVWLGRLELQIQTAVQVLMRNALNDFAKKDFRKWSNCWPEQMILGVDSYMWATHIDLILQEPPPSTQQATAAAPPATASASSSRPPSSAKRNDANDANDHPTSSAASPPLLSTKSKLQTYLTNELESRIHELVAELADPSVHGMTASRIHTLTNVLTQTLHARDVTADLIEQDVADADAFAWQSMLRYSWNDGNLHVKMLKGSIAYGYEYVGNRPAVVVVPNTLKCARVLFAAFGMAKGTCVSGPAGAGKTTALRAVATACAKLFVLYSCGAACHLDELVRLLKGVAACGAWFCLDDVHNLARHDVGVVVDMIQRIQEATLVRDSVLVLEGVKLRLKRGAHVMATFQPSPTVPRLPVFFVGLFRPAVVVPPSLRHVAQVLFFVAGFPHPHRLAQLVEFTLTTATDLLAKDGVCQNLASLGHVARVVAQAKTWLALDATQALHPTKVSRDELVVTHVLADVLGAQLSTTNTALYELNGLVKDMLRSCPDPLAPPMESLPPDAVKLALSSKQLVHAAPFVAKLRQLHHALEHHAGVLVLGDVNSGKTALYTTLAHVYKILDERLAAFSRRTGPATDSTAVHVVAPAAVTLAQLFGSVAPSSKAFQDGILTRLLRKLNAAAAADAMTMDAAPATTSPLRSWLVLDGEIDPVWADGFNTLLDDTGSLHTPAGEAIPLPPRSRVLFEASDASAVSPSLVARCAIVHVDAGVVVTWRMLYAAWIERMPEYLESIDDVKDALDATIDMVEPALEFVRHHFHAAPLSDAARVTALLSLMDASFRATYPKMGSMTAKQNYTIAQCIFLQSLVWGVGHTTHHDERVKFDAFLRSLAGEPTAGGTTAAGPAATVASSSTTTVGGAPSTPAATATRHLTVNAKKINMFFPAGRNDLVYSFALSAEWGLKWEPWVDFYPNHCFTPPPLPGRHLSEMFVPTTTTAAAAHFIDVLTQNATPFNHVLVVGPRDSGKSAVVDVFCSQAAVRAKALLDAPASSAAPPTPGTWENTPVHPSLMPPPPATLGFIKHTCATWLAPAHLLRSFENAMERSRKNVLSAPAGKTCVLVLDDVGLDNPTTHVGGCPLESLRHLLGCHVIYEPKTDVDCIVRGLACVATLTMRPAVPAAVSARLLSKLTPLGLTSVLDSDLTKLLTGITVWLAQSRNLSLDFTQLIAGAVKATVRLFHAVVDRFRLSPRTPQYDFGLSDLVSLLHMASRECPATTLTSDKFPAVRLWCHEATRQFHDRLVSAADATVFYALLRDTCTSGFGVTMEMVFPNTITALSATTTTTSGAAAMPLTPSSPALARRSSRAAYGSIDKLNTASTVAALASSSQQQQQPMTAVMYACFQRLCFTDLHPDGHYVEVSDMMPIHAMAGDALAKLTETPRRPSGLRDDVDIQTTYAMDHIVRLHRLIKDYNPASSAIRRDHVLLMGRPGTGKSILARLAAALTGAAVFYMDVQSPALATDGQWRQQLADILVRVTTDNKPAVLIVKDALVGSRPRCLDDLTSLVVGNFVPEFLSDDAVDALAPVLREVAKDHNLFLENAVAVEAYCVERLREYLKIVVVVTATTPTTHLPPRLLHRCRVDYMDMWPDDAFVAVAQRQLAMSCLTTDQIKTFMLVCLQLHRLAMPFESPGCIITPARVLQHMIAFTKQFGDQSPVIDARKTKLAAALETIRYVEKLANRVSSTVSDLEPELHRVHNTSKAINVGLTTDTQAILLTQRKLDAEEALRQSLEGRVHADRERYDGTLKAATNMFLEGRAALRELTMHDIGELVALPPTTLLKLLYECLGRLLQLEPIEISDERDVNTRMMDYSEPLIAQLRDPATLAAFQSHGVEFVGAMADTILGPLVPIYELVEFVPLALAELHPVAGVLCTWVRAMLHYRQTLVLLKPQWAHIETQQVYWQTCVDKCAALARTLHDQTTAMGHAKASREATDAQVLELVAKLTDHSTAIEKASVVLASIDGFVRAWHTARDDAMMWADHIAGDLLVATGLLMYGCHLPAFGRRQLVLAWVKALHHLGHFTSDGLLTNAPHHAVSDLLLEHGLLQRWLALGVPDDVVCRENAAFLSSTELVPLLVDPHRIAFSWIMSKDMTESKTPLVLRPTSADADALAAVEADMFHALQEGRPVVFPAVDSLVKAVALPVLLARHQYAAHGLRKPNILTLAPPTADVVDGPLPSPTLVEFQSTWALYLCTTDVAAPSLQLFASHAHVIYVELTPQVCVDLFRAEFVCNSSKHTAHRWKELRLSAVEHRADARRIENDCLDALARAKSEDSIFGESARLFAWRGAHRDALNRYELVASELNEAQYMPFAMDDVLQRFVDVALAFDDVTHVAPRVYAFSIKWVVSLLTYVLDVVGRENAPLLLEKFTNTAYRILHWSVREQDRLEGTQKVTWQIEN